MIENPNIAAQDRHNNRPYEPMEEHAVSTGCRECGEWDARKTYDDGLCIDCRTVNVFPTFQSSSTTPLTEYRVLTECGRNFAWSAFDLESLMRDLISKGYRAKRVQTMDEYVQETARMRQLDKLATLEKVRIVRARKGRRQRA